MRTPPHLLDPAGALRRRAGVGRVPGESDCPRRRWTVPGLATAGARGHRLADLGRHEPAAVPTRGHDQAPARRIAYDAPAAELAPPSSPAVRGRHLVMERRLVEAHGPDPADDLGANWHYHITHDGQDFTQHVFHYPDEGVYRTRVFQYWRDELGRCAEAELWTFADGHFGSPASALALGAELIRRRCAEGKTDRPP
ncbi:MAG TPA: hypothetical protein VFC93_18445 [Chloroflexota bacterium]|nr:hypothetical protein [Chloroflexota bacterium]